MLRDNKLMDQYGNLGPYQDPKIRAYYDSIQPDEPVEEPDNE